MQFGFQSNYSTTDALLFATGSIRQSLDQNQFVAAAFLDLSKAFDSISHGILFEKLEELNFDSNALSLMKSYLTERYQKVTLPNCSSEWIKLYQGVPQGTVFGPLLFNIYVNDMENVNDDNQCKIIQYADDTMIFCSHEEPEKAKSAVEKIIQKLVLYFETHQLTINAEKTEFILFSKPSKNETVEHLKLQVKDQTIQTSSYVK